jgi:hypothetical protein
VRLRLIVTLALIGAALVVPRGVGAQPSDPSGNGGGTPGTSSNFELVGHEPLFGRGMNSALAMSGDVVYVGSRTDGSSTCGLGDPRGDVDPNSCPHPNPGILIVDAADPTAPAVVGEIGPPYAGNVDETTRELRVWPEQEILIALNFRCSPVIHACAGGAVTPTYRFFDISDPLDPVFISEWVPRQANGTIRTPHEFFLWDDPADPDRTLLWMSTPTLSVVPDNANMLIADLAAVPDGGEPVLVAQGNWNPQYPGAEDPANYDFNLALHSMTPTFDGTRTHLAYLSGHFLVVDTTTVARDEVPPGTVEDLNDDLLTPPENRPTWENPNPGHSAVPFPGRPFSLVTDEVYGTFTSDTFGCPWGWARAIQVANPRRPRVADEYRIAENSCPPPSQADQERASYAAHNPTLTRKLALVSWHSGGLQAIDIKRPRQLRQAGWFSPEPLAEVANEDPALSGGDNKVVMWSFPIVKDGLIYVTDVRNGLYILRYTGPRAGEVSSLNFLEGNSNLGDAARLNEDLGD